MRLHDPLANGIIAGFQTVDLSDALQHMAAADLQLLVRGSPTLDPQDVVDLLRFQGFSDQSPTPEALCDFLLSASQVQLRQFLRLVTSLIAIPPGGFRQPITVQCSFDPSKLPCGHTCTRACVSCATSCLLCADALSVPADTLDLPDYQFKDLLRDKMSIALEHTDTTGFDFV